jgi:hypothetical protein
MSEETVGNSESPYYELQENVNDRISLIGAFISLKELEITEADEELAKKDAAAEAYNNRKKVFLEHLEREAAKDRPGACKYSLNGEDGFLYARTDSHPVHFRKGVGGYLCKRDQYEKAGLEPVCCDNDDRGPFLSHVVVILQYLTDNEGELIEVPEYKQSFIPGTTEKLPYKYSIKYWQISDAKMKAWKGVQKEYPPISSDFYVKGEKQGNGLIAKFSNCSECKWQKNEKLREAVIGKAHKDWWSKAGQKLGKDLSIDEIDRSYGIERPKKNNEASYGELLG